MIEYLKKAAKSLMNYLCVQADCFALDNPIFSKRLYREDCELVMRTCEQVEKIHRYSP